MNFFNRSQGAIPDLLSSILYDETTFYNQFKHDLLLAQKEVIIESPFISTHRMQELRSLFEKIIHKGIKVYIFTRDPKEHCEEYEMQSEAEVQYFERLGVQVLLCIGNHHRKLAMVDRKILWEGSLNILSQIHSREIMRRTVSPKMTQEMFDFLKFSRWI
ncbi:MAG TPA: phospholipase D-like domain-containing protein [Candidatus Nitrosocosmicus sp.]|nr:phospholipase D-like domain-containing protein [Candidatus Nitrosocosmicus sp.]